MHVVVSVLAGIYAPAVRPSPFCHGTSLTEVWRGRNRPQAVQRSKGTARHLLRSQPPMIAIHYNYRVQPDAVVIIRVLLGARDIAAIAEYGGFDV